jgi:hypothetical protein
VLSALFTNSHTCAFKREELYSDSGAVPPRQSMLDNLLDSWAYFEFPPITAQDRELFLKHASAPFLYADQPVDISSFLRFFTSFFRLNIGFNEEGFVRAGIQVAVHLRSCSWQMAVPGIAFVEEVCQVHHPDFVRLVALQKALQISASRDLLRYIRLGFPLLLHVLSGCEFTS